MRSYPILFIRSLLFTIGYVLTSGIAGMVSLIVYPLPFRWRFQVVVLWNRFIMLWIYITCGIRFKIIGQRQHSVEPAVIISKHASTWETMFLQYYFAPTSTVLKQELLRIPFFGWGLATLKPIAIDRGSPIKALKKIKTDGKKRLAEGINVLVYPEGTRIPYGQTGNYARSGTDIACAAGVPVIPIAHNAGKYWPNKQLIKTPGTITVVIGEPISTEGKNSKQLTAEIKEWIENEIQKM